MGIGPRARPRHGKGAKVRNLHGLGNVNPAHGARALNQQVRVLARVHGRQQQLVQPPAKRRIGLAEERVRKGAILDAQLHQSPRVALHLGKLYPVALDPRLELGVRGDARLVPLGNEPLAERNVRLHVAP